MPRRPAVVDLTLTRTKVEYAVHLHGEHLGYVVCEHNPWDDDDRQGGWTVEDWVTRNLEEEVARYPTRRVAVDRLVELHRLEHPDCARCRHSEEQHRLLDRLVEASVATSDKTG